MKGMDELLLADALRCFGLEILAELAREFSRREPPSGDGAVAEMDIGRLEKALQNVKAADARVRVALAKAG